MMILEVFLIMYLAQSEFGSDLLQLCDYTLVFHYSFFNCAIVSL